MFQNFSDSEQESWRVEQEWSLKNVTPLISGYYLWEDFSKLKLIRNYLRSSMITLRLRNLATLQQLTDNINFDIANEEFANKKVRKVTV